MFQAEWEALEMCPYKWALEGVDKEVFLESKKAISTVAAD